MDNKELLHIAMEQSAEDMGCTAEDFLKRENVLVPLRLGKGARKYLKEPIVASFVSYGNNVVAAAAGEAAEIAAEYMGQGAFYRLFETPRIHWLGRRLAEIEAGICFMAEYFLPDVENSRPAPRGVDLRVLEQPDLRDLYRPEWSNALCKERRHLDVLGVGAYDGGRLVGLAGCSADCDLMWQIGVDVLPEYRRRGIASALTGALAGEILRRGKAPFYCCAWSNIPSARNALASGFRPAWVEMTVKPRAVIDEMNRI